MEDILNLWTKELEKQTKDFHNQANQVAQWDQQLIENGNKVKKKRELFSSSNAQVCFLVDFYFT
jgi:nuclear pore complex protein Nup62